MKRALLVPALAIVVLSVLPARAFAGGRGGGSSFSIGFGYRSGGGYYGPGWGAGFAYSNGGGWYAPAPVYCAPPAPVYCPPPVVVAPAPVYCPPPVVYYRPAYRYGYGWPRHYGRVGYAYGR